MAELLVVGVSVAMREVGAKVAAALMVSFCAVACPAVARHAVAFPPATVLPLQAVVRWDELLLGPRGARQGSECRKRAER